MREWYSNKLNRKNVYKKNDILLLHDWVGLLPSSAESGNQPVKEVRRWPAALFIYSLHLSLSCPEPPPRARSGGIQTPTSPRRPVPQICAPMGGICAYGLSLSLGRIWPAHGPHLLVVFLKKRVAQQTWLAKKQNYDGPSTYRLFILVF